jgi:LuxR family quorum sensing-dependent transcriptional regulator
MNSAAHFAFDTIDEIEKLADLQSVRSKIDQSSKACGYESYVITAFPRSINEVHTALIDTWPEEWKRLYLDRAYSLQDRVAGYCRNTHRPFDWHTIPSDFMRTTRGREITVVAQDCGLHHGRAIPVWGIHGDVGAIGFTGARRVEDPAIQRAIDFIGMCAYNKVADLARPKSTPERNLLSSGERDVLAWIAVGKSNWDISEILGISERGVDWRLKQAFRKLNAVSRAHAVVQAIRTGQLPL